MLSLNQLNIRARGKQYTVETDLGPCEEVDFYNGVMTLINPPVVDKDDFLNYVDNLTIKGEFDPLDKELLIERLGLLKYTKTSKVEESEE